MLQQYCELRRSMRQDPEDFKLAVTVKKARRAKGAEEGEEKDVGRRGRGGGRKGKRAGKVAGRGKGRAKKRKVVEEEEEEEDWLGESESETERQVEVGSSEGEE